jgi:ATP-binding cassette subfamily B protein
LYPEVLGRWRDNLAHRLSIIRSANRILVLQKGRIIEEGNHQTLMQQGGHYAELYDTYFRYPSPDFVPTLSYRTSLAPEEIGTG